MFKCPGGNSKLVSWEINEAAISAVFRKGEVGKSYPS